MTITQVSTTQAFGFADGGAGHLCDFGSPPAIGDFDVLCANSDTTMHIPTDFTQAVRKLNNQDAQIWYRKAVGGEGSTVTVTTDGNNNCQASWLRWRGLDAFDVAAAASVDASVGGSSPAATTAALAAAGELVVCFAALHSTASANQTAPTWTAGYSTAGVSVQSSGSPGCVGLTAYRIGAGTAAETAQATGWTGDGAFDRYTLLATFTAAATPPPPSNGAGAVPVRRRRR